MWNKDKQATEVKEVVKHSEHIKLIMHTVQRDALLRNTSKVRTNIKVGDAGDCFVFKKSKEILKDSPVPLFRPERVLLCDHPQIEAPAQFLIKSSMCGHWVGRAVDTWLREVSRKFCPGGVSQRMSFGKVLSQGKGLKRSFEIKRQQIWPTIGQA